MQSSVPGVAYIKHSVNCLCIIHSHKHLLGICYMPGSVLGGQEAAVNKTEGLLEGLYSSTILLHITTILTRSGKSQPINQ